MDMLPSSRQAWKAGWLVVLVLQGWNSWPAVGHCQASDAVDRLRQVLKATAEPADRDRSTRACLNGLKTLSDLRRALTLAEWRDRNPDSTYGAVDAANRAIVAERFQQSFRQVFARHEATSATVALTMLADIANTGRTAGESVAYLRPLGPDLAGLVMRAPAKVQGAAARTLGLIDPDITVAVPALAGLLQSKDPTLRCAAAEGLFDLLQTAAKGTAAEGPVSRASGPRRVVVAVACLVLPASGKGTGDWHVEVRRRCVTTVGAAAAVLARLIPDPGSGVVPEGVDLSARVREEREELRPLAVALRDQGPGLTRCLRDNDTDIRLAAQKALEEVADARARWLRHGGAELVADDPLLDGLRASLPALSDAAGDADLRVRRAALDVLGALGAAAEPAIPALTRALRDPDRFVRWSAIRTLGAIGPAAAKPALPGLTLLLDDDDLDVRKAAAETIKHLSPAPGITPANARKPAATRAAVPALVRSVRSGDPEMRVAAIQTLCGMNAELKPALPALRECLGDGDARVRKAAADALGLMGPAARDAANDLRGAMNDQAPEVRQAAGEALLNVLRPASR
jgi:HEAT repeat protein